MAAARQCDRCKGYFITEMCDGHLELEAQNFSSCLSFTSKYDLCKKCANEFKDFMNPIKKEEE